MTDLATIDHAQTVISEGQANDIFLGDAAEAIQKLNVQAASNVLHMGQLLTQVRRLFPLGGPRRQWYRLGEGGERETYRDWVEKNCLISYSWAKQIHAIYVRVGDDLILSDGRFVRVGWHTLQFLAKPGIPDGVVQQVVQQAETGQRVMYARVKEIAGQLNKSTLTAAEAREEAKRKGHGVMARDGKIYTGASKEEIADADRRKQQVYQVRHAMDAIIEIAGLLTPVELLDQATSWQDWTVDEAQNFQPAIDYLTELRQEWERRHGYATQ